MKQLGRIALLVTWLGVAAGGAWALWTIKAWAGNDALGALNLYATIWHQGDVAVAYASIYYPLPQILALSWVAWLPSPVWTLRALEIVALVASLSFWGIDLRRRWILVVPLVISLPFINLLILDQFQTMAGLLFLSAALWAQRQGRWWLAGALLALGSIRVVQAIPIAVMLLVGSGFKVRPLLKMILGGLVVGLPLTWLAYLAVPSWPQEWIGNLLHYPFHGPLGELMDRTGLWGELGLLTLFSLGVGLLVWRQRGRTLDADRSALVMALTVLIAPTNLFYAFVFYFPALLRAGLRPGYEKTPWLASGLIWAVFLLVFAVAFSYLPLIGLPVLILGLFHCYPLLRKRSEASGLVSQSGESLAVTSLGA